MISIRFVLFATLSVASNPLLRPVAYATEHAATAEQLEFFEREVRPLLASHCYSCHSTKAKKVHAGLLVDSPDALLRGGDSGPALVPGDADASMLIEAVRYESYEMPPKGKLSEKKIAVLEQWVAMGAPWPDEASPTLGESESTFKLQQRKSEHWVWQPVRSPRVPEVQNESWPRNNMDRFVLSRLESNGLHPSPDADRSAILRRIYFDLIGLPPTPEQAHHFLSDTSPKSLERLVDRVLDSPHFGERWGRHWLDLVRYAESRGHEFDDDSRNAFQYRDYIIRAFNQDIPYDQLVREHLAGDLLTDPRLNPKDGFNESVLGTGFWFLGEWVHSPVDIRKDEADRFDNMVDVMSKTFLGVTVSCARCHDHKFDAISTADYYSLCGFLQSSDYRQVRFESLEHNRTIAETLATVDDRYRQRISKLLSDAGIKTSPSESLQDSGSNGIVVDYSTLAPEQYLQDGFIFGDRPRKAADPCLVTEDGKPFIRFATSSSAANDPFWNGLESINEKGIHHRNKLSGIPRSGRTLRTPTFTLSNGDVACRVRGTGHVVACVDSHRLIAGPLHGETIKPIKGADGWVELNLNRYVGHRLHLEFTPAEDAQLEVSLITQGVSKKDRKRLDQNASRVAESVAEFADLAKGELPEALADLARQWGEERSSLRRDVKFRSRLAMAMMDGTGEDDHVLIRGNSSKPGAVEPRHFLTAIAGDSPMPIRSGSGRLELADQINDPMNPLTSRVIVNRIFHYLMGRGIVPTTDDFGVLGRLPTHPDLLDHLASEFLRHDRSIKQMIRSIVLSRTYQMSSQADEAAVAADPNNLLWHYRPPKRLEGEVIRDSLLALSGRLDATQFGEPVPIHLTAFMDGRGRPGKSGPLDGAGRRTIYTAVRRNFISPNMMAFDTPVPFSTMGRRNVSNVPAQALILLNDPLIVELAGDWAQLGIDQNRSVSSRIKWLYQTAFARQPTQREIAVSQTFLDDQVKRRGVDQDNSRVWADFAHALINTKEFIFLR